MFISIFHINIKVIGILSIEISGAVYCPLSPRDPPQRLETLLEQTKSRVLLVHSMTGKKFDREILRVDIEMMINMQTVADNTDYDLLSSVRVTFESIAYVIFTSGSTGTPKAVGFSSR